jgi:uncharacterized protein (DUF2249 family)/quercetin dioxygenase-like cupin family protein
VTETVAARRSITIADGAGALIDLLPVRDDAVATKRILKAPGFGLVRFSFGEGQGLAEHEAAVPILVQVLSGTVDIEVDGTTSRFETGGILYIAAHVRHALNAVGRADVLLTLADAATRVPSDGAGVGETRVPAATPAGTAAEPHVHVHGGPAGAAPVGGVAAPADSSPLVDAAALVDAHGGPDPEHRSLLQTTGAGSDPTACTCGEVDGLDYPELDVREVPHAIRHATVFGALNSLDPNQGLVLIAGHDPLPLLAQIRQLTGDRYEVTYLERGPEAWSLQFVNTGDVVA